MYPLTEDYEQVVTDFCLALKAIPEAQVIVNGVSTQVFGPYEAIWEGVGKAVHEVFESEKAIAVMKWAGSELRPEGIRTELK